MFLSNSPTHVPSILIFATDLLPTARGGTHPKNAHTISWRDVPSFLAMLTIWVTDIDP